MKKKSIFTAIGPGIIVAATGLGAGDIVAASLAGARFGTVILWAVVLGAVLKFVLTEGLARWQLVTGKTLLEGWFDSLPKIIVRYFLVYLVLWSFMVAAALMAATGLAAHAIFSSVSVTTWGILHALVALLIVWLGRYQFLEILMKLFVGLMFISILFCAVMVAPEWKLVFSGMLIPAVPSGSLIYILGIIGGVGGSVTIMSYGYWMRESGWRNTESMPDMRRDLSLAYTITGLFGVALVLISAGIEVETMSGNDMALAVADRLGQVLGTSGKWIFLVGFWGAVFSSMIGVWHGVPYLFANYVLHATEKSNVTENIGIIHQSMAYRGYLLYISILPMSLLFLERPVWIVVLYAVTGAFFMPGLAGLLLYMNNKQEWLGSYTNSLYTKLLLFICMLIFGVLLVRELITIIS